jgi:hypothetical protein
VVSFADELEKTKTGTDQACANPNAAIIPKPHVLSSGARDLACTGTQRVPQPSRVLCERLGILTLKGRYTRNKGCPIFRVLCEKWEATPHAAKAVDVEVDAEEDIGLALCGAGAVPLTLIRVKKECHPEEGIEKAGWKEAHVSPDEGSLPPRTPPSPSTIPLSFPPAQGKNKPDCEGVTATPWPLPRLAESKE